MIRSDTSLFFCSGLCSGVTFLYTILYWGMGKMRTCGRVNCGPSLRTRSAFYPRALRAATARVPSGALTTLWALGFTLVIPFLPSLTFLPPLLRRSYPVPSPFPSLPLAEPQQKSNLVHFGVKM